MPSYRRPKGVYSRPTLDWFSDQVCTGAGAFQTFPLSGTGNDIHVSLFNNDTLGRLLYVYAISCGNDSAENLYCAFHAGTVGNFFAAGMSVNPSLGTPPGQIFLDVRTGTGSTPLAPPSDPYTQIPSGFNSSTIVAPFPLFILPKGYSIVVSPDFSGQSLGASFWYIPLQGN